MVGTGAVVNGAAVFVVVAAAERKNVTDITNAGIEQRSCCIVHGQGGRRARSDIQANECSTRHADAGEGEGHDIEQILPESVLLILDAVPPASP